MKVGDYVIVTDYRGSYSGYIKRIRELSIEVECNCCFTWKWCKKENVRVQ